jgi:hypothetical protein
MIPQTRAFDDACGDYLRLLERDYHISQDFLSTPRARRQCVFLLRHGRSLQYVLRRSQTADGIPTRSVHSCIVTRDHPRLRLRVGDLLRFDGHRTRRTSAVYGNIFQPESYVRYARWYTIAVPAHIAMPLSETW